MSAVFVPGSASARKTKSTVEKFYHPIPGQVPIGLPMPFELPPILFGTANPIWVSISGVCVLVMVHQRQLQQLPISSPGLFFILLKTKKNLMIPFFQNWSVTFRFFYHPFTELCNHLLNIAPVQIQLLGDLFIREIQSHEVQTEYPDLERLVVSGKDSAGQIIEALSAIFLIVFAKKPLIIQDQGLFLKKMKLPTASGGVLIDHNKDEMIILYFPVF
jgi:hypothetical protein